MYQPLPTVQVFNGLNGGVLFERTVQYGITMAHIIEDMLETDPHARLARFIDIDTNRIINRSDIPPSKIGCIRIPFDTVIMEYIERKNLTGNVTIGAEDSIELLMFCVANSIDYRHYSQLNTYAKPFRLMSKNYMTISFQMTESSMKDFVRRFFESSSLESIISTQELGSEDVGKLTGVLIGNCIMKSLETDDLPIDFWRGTLYKYQWHLLAKITMEKNQLAWTKVMNSIGKDGSITEAKFCRIFAKTNIARACIGFRAVNGKKPLLGKKSKSRDMGMLLHLAAMHSNEFVIRDLLRMGVSKKVRNRNGKIAFELLPRKASKFLRAELKP